MTEKLLRSASFLWQPLDSGPRSFGLFDSSEEAKTEPLVAVLRFKNPVGTLAQGEADSRCWTFKRVGVWQPFLSLRTVPEERDFGVYRRLPGIGTGILSLADGSGFRVSEAGTREGLTVFSSQGEPLVFLRTREKKRLFADAYLAPDLIPLVGKGDSERGPSSGEPSGALLVVFAWYLQLLAFLDETEAKSLKRP